MLKLALDHAAYFPIEVFSAALFFSYLREAGGNPFVKDGGLYCGIPQRTEALRLAGIQAGLLDPDGKIRLAYARSMWEGRLPGVRVVTLGLPSQPA